jgi:hypothetical protein
MRKLIVTLMVLYSAATLAGTKVWLIGGGNTAGNSQGQIEENVRWLQEILKAGGIPFRTYFTSGTRPERDVIYFAAPQERDLHFDRILRVFGDASDYATRMRRNTLERIDGSTEKELLVDGLGRDFARVEAPDSVLIVYNGHGDADFEDTSRNALKLWRDGRLSVSEFGTVLDRIDRRATVRFVMTQCFSGAFARIAIEPPGGINAGGQNRCGFFSQSDTREAEGCDLGINRAEFRDYTTYFFAALTGKTRLGDPIPVSDIDSDQSGHVSFDEAHYYTLKHGRSMDLPRSTSEVYLEKAEPWYLRWNSFARGEAGNRYRTAAEHIAERERIPSHGPALVGEVLRRDQVLADTGRMAEVAADEIEQMQADLRRQVVRRFPSTSADRFWQSMQQHEIVAISAFVAGLPDYEELRAAQDRQADTEERLLAVQRTEGQAERVLWLNRISRLGRYASWLPAATRTRLRSLQECEQGRP